MLKNLVLLSLLMFMFSCSSSVKVEDYKEMPWVSIDQVENLEKKEPRKILVDVYTSWCGPCKMMDKNTFSDSTVIGMIAKNFYAVKFNAEGNEEVTFKGKKYGNPRYNPAKAKRRNSKHELSNFFAVRGYPTLVVMDENMKIIDRIVGYKKPDQLLQALEKYTKK